MIFCSINVHYTIVTNAHYLIIKINDNNRLLQSKEIESKCFSPDIPAKNGKENKTDTKSDNKTNNDMDQEEQAVTVEDIKNEYDTEIKVECGDEESEQDYSAYTVQITSDAEDAVADDEATDAI